MTIRRNGNVVVDLLLADAVGDRIRFGVEKLHLTVVLRELSQALLVHGLMNALIQHSDRLVDEQFRYRGFARFSHHLDPARLTQLSVVTRTALPDEQFERVRKSLNYDTDTRRVPALGAGELARKNRHALQREGKLGGHLPAGLIPEPEPVEATG